MRVGIDSVPDPMLATDAHERVPSLSPDGRWLVFMSDATGQDQIHVRPFPDGDEDWVVSRDGGVEPLWSPAGNEIFYRNADEQMVAVEVQTSPTFAALRRRTLFATDLYRRESNHRAYDVTADGERFLMIRNSDPSGEFIWVQNFFEELKERVPN